jgi:DNA-binding CsgD family transcriptional regulator
MVAEGLTNAGIAGRLGLSPRSGHAHLHSAYGKPASARTAAGHREQVTFRLVIGSDAP